MAEKKNRPPWFLSALLIAILGIGAIKVMVAIERESAGMTRLEAGDNAWRPIVFCAGVVLIGLLTMALVGLGKKTSIFSWVLVALGFLGCTFFYDFIF